MSGIEESTMLSAVCTILEEQGFSGIPHCVEILINEAMLIERSQASGATPYQRCEERKGYANGFKAKTVKSRLGNLRFSVPQLLKRVFAVNGH